MSPVRPLRPDEWPQLREVRRRALEDVPGAFGATWDEERRRPDDWWKTRAVDTAWFVAEEDGRMVGLAAGVPPGELRPGAELVSMWVEPGRRGSGLAGELLARVVDWAHERGERELTLHVADGNPGAMRFYERAGFSLTGRAEPLRSDLSRCTWEMRKTLHGREAGLS
jgi:GNAT superfamily N-acetyltransferase